MSNLVKASKDIERWHSVMASIVSPSILSEWYQEMYPIMLTYIKNLEKTVNKLPEFEADFKAIADTLSKAKPKPQSKDNGGKDG